MTRKDEASQRKRRLTGLLHLVVELKQWHLLDPLTEPVHDRACGVHAVCWVAIAVGIGGSDFSSSSREPQQETGDPLSFLLGEEEPRKGVKRTRLHNALAG